MRVKKKFMYDGIELRIVERQEKYLNAKDTITMTRVMAPNGGIIPVKIKHKQTLKSIQEDAVEVLDTFKKSGADTKAELTKEI